MRLADLRAGRDPMTSPTSLSIALVAPYDLSVAGGVNNQIRAHASALRGLGHAVRICGPASGALADGEVALGRTINVTFGGTESGLGVDPRAFVAVRRMLRERFDIVHVHEPFTPLVPWIVLLGARAPLVGTFHVHREDGHRLYAATSWALQPLARRLRARIAVSDAARRTVEPHFPGRYDIVPNGIDVGRFQTARPRPVRMAADRRWVLYVGRLEPRKGVDVLIYAMSRVQKRVPEAALLIVGDGSERQRLERLASATGISATFAGALPDDDVIACLQAADIVCSPAIGGESFGIVLLEAMAAGKPIVASRIAGYAELIGDADCARLVPPGEDGSLATELLALITNEALRRRIGACGANDVRQYDLDAIARRLVDIYRRVLAK
jgi:phosphatidylinositol alpha-mannosyltransferase